jgi:hypothetical protein
MAYARAIVGAVVCTIVFAAGAWAQSVISAHSGVIHYVEGDVTIDGTAVHPKFAEFPDVKAGQLLATEEGRVEVLLTPGVFLRLAENSSVRMLSNALADTRLEVVTGSALVEVGELLEHNAIAFDAAGAHMALAKKGLYRIDASPAQLRVYDGQALVTVGSENLTAKKGHEIDLDTAKLVDARFDTKDTDSFYRWSARRAEYVAAANVISARVASNSDSRSGFTNSRGAWSWNPYFGMYTFLPGSGVYWSPFGSPFYSPGMVTAIYIPQRSVSAASSGYGAPASLGGSSVSSPSSGGAAPGGFGGGGGGGFSGGASHASGPSRASGHAGPIGR